MAHYSKVLVGSSGGGFRSYVAQLTQSGNIAPIANILSNTLGYTPTWSRSSAGFYTLNATEFATVDSTKVAIFFNPANYVPNNFSDSGLMPRVEALWGFDSNYPIIRTGFMLACGEGGNCNDVFSYTLADGYLSGGTTSGDYFKASFELRIYN
jgi:hypothetical protein